MRDSRDLRELQPGWIRFAAHLEALAPEGVSASELARAEDAAAEQLHEHFLLTLAGEPLTSATSATPAPDRSPDLGADRAGPR